MSLVLGTFFYSIASALIPVLNAEIPLAGIPTSSASSWLFAFAAASGQTVGKVIWYYAGQHSMKVPWLRRKMETEKWRKSYATWNARIEGRPVVAGAICFASGVGGLPPLAIVSVLAGSLRMNLTVFIVTVLAGRTLRFWLVVEGAAAIKHLVGIG